MFIARYGLIHYIKQITFRLWKVKFQHVNTDSIKITQYEGLTYMYDMVFSYVLKDASQRNHPVNETISFVCHTMRVNV